MIALPAQIRVFLYRLPTDMRKSFHGLVALTESALKQDPLSGSLFVFFNRRRDRIKILYWGQTGFCIWYQQLQKGTYQLPDEQSLAGRETVEVTRAQLSLILDGIDLSSARQRMRFQSQREPAGRSEPASLSAPA
jgi:transposase